MNHESGRSLIEVIGVMALVAIFTISAIATYNMIRERQLRTIASEELANIAKNTKLLLGASGDYTFVSREYLEKAGALRGLQPFRIASWGIKSDNLGAEFVIVLTRMTQRNCEYFSLAQAEWAYRVTVNGLDGGACMNSVDNEVSFHVK